MEIVDRRNEEIVQQVRANVAFEHMVAAVLIGAGVSGAALFLMNEFFSLMKIGFSLGALVSIAMNAIWAAFLIFLGGFAAAVVFGVPLFLSLERAKYRRTWPFFVAAIAAHLIALALISGGVPAIETPAALLFFTPGLLVAFLFARRIAPLWEASRRAETNRTLYRVH